MRKTIQWRAIGRRPTGRTSIAAVAVALLVAGCTHQGGAPRPPPKSYGPSAARIKGPLTTRGTQIVDAAGQTVRVLSIEASGMASGVGLPGAQGMQATGCPGWQPPSPTEIANIASWGFNTVRVPMSWANLEPNAPSIGSGGKPVHVYNQAYIQAYDGIVQAFTSRGIAVVVQMAQSGWSPAFSGFPTNKGTTKCQGVGMPTWLYPNPNVSQALQARIDFFNDVSNVQQGYVDAWSFVVQRYASNPMVVGADMFNEPFTKGQPAASLHLNDLYDRIGRAIRAVSPRILLIFQDSNVDSSGQLALASAPAFDNEVYEFHLYTANWNPLGLAKATVYFNRAQQWNVPMWIGEFDAFGYASPFPVDPNWRPDLEAFLAWCKSGDVSWSVFTYAPRWFLQPGGGVPQPRAGLMEILAQQGF